jgi:ATP:cob(I)alamin adenosyltransferase
VFTREGDKGDTSVVAKRVGKDSPLVNFLGDLDELSSFLGFAASKIPWPDMREDIYKIQIHLFEIGEDVATDSQKKRITEEYVKFLEERTVAYRKESGPVKLFVLPGGSEVASAIHLARAVARRVERGAVKLSKEIPEMNKTIIVYLNRLSSLLFAMAVLANKRLGVEERYYDIGKYW